LCCRVDVLLIICRKEMGQERKRELLLVSSFV
jgi:hypothetical protein